MKAINLFGLILCTLFFCNSCDFADGSLFTKPTQIFTQQELMDNLQKLQKSGDYATMDDMEFWDLNIQFSHSNIESNCDVMVSYNLLDAKDKTELANHSYKTGNITWHTAYNVKIVDADNKEVKDYSLFKDNLFKISELKQFENLDKLMQDALDRSEKKDENNYVETLDIGAVPQITYSIKLGNKKDRSFRETFKYNDKGELIK